MSMYVPRAILNQILDANWHPVAVDLFMWWHHKPGDVISASPFASSNFRNWHSKINLLTLKTVYIHKHSKTNVIFEVQIQESTTSTNFRHKSMFLGLQENSLSKQGCQNCRNKSSVPERGGICFCKPFVKQHHPSIGVTCPRMPKTMWTKSFERNKPINHQQTSIH